MNRRAMVIATFLVVTILAFTSCASSTPTNNVNTNAGEEGQSLVERLRILQSQNQTPVAATPSVGTATPAPAATTITGPQAIATVTGRTPEQIIADVQETFKNLSQFQGTASVTANTDGRQVATSLRIWFQQPSNFRVELLEPVEDTLAQGTTLVVNDQTLTLYQPDQNKVTRIEDFPQVSLLVHVPQDGNVPVLDALNLRSFVAGLRNGTAITSVGQEQVLGRQTEVIEVQPQTDDTRFASARIWADESTNLPLRVEITRPNGEMLFRFEFTSLNTESQVPADTFTFQAPQDAEVRNLTIQDLSIELDLVQTTMAEAAQQADFTVYQLPALPQGANQSFVHTADVNNSTVVAIFYGTTERISTSLVQSKASDLAVDFRGEETVTINGAQAQLLQVDGTTTLTWVQNETRLAMASSLERNQVIDLANSLTPVN